ncbi:hypothetical protein BZA05DRAFT_416219 [Tricharina praecox]|uniref:uncharacterized protein n=1 Tax=Tricharina praecox TaxID=43433 RepID=UPI00221EF44F|nr:uncharacterized protein BZA05DRAFT_416219 [Tricharina praecox]KAI5856565.1 hypothetical protein BZA05DRAFT_416219 [Tricharina praecox]
MNSSIERMFDNGWDWKVGKITEEVPVIITRLPANMETCVGMLVKRLKGTVTTIIWSVIDVTLRSSTSSRRHPPVKHLEAGKVPFLMYHRVPTTLDPPATVAEPAPAQTAGQQKLASVIWQHEDPLAVEDERHWICKHCLDKHSGFNSNSGFVPHHLRNFSWAVGKLRDRPDHQEENKIRQHSEGVEEPIERPVKCAAGEELREPAG